MRQDAIDFLQGRAGEYDAIVGIDFLEHLDRDGLADLMPLVSQALRRGGLFIVQTVNIAGLNAARVAYGDLTHETFFTESSIRQLMNAYHLEVVITTEAAPHPVTLRGAIRAVLWRIVRLAPIAVSLVQTGGAQRVWTQNLVCVAVSRGARDSRDL